MPASIYEGRGCGGKQPGRFGEGGTSKRPFVRPHLIGHYPPLTGHSDGARHEKPVIAPASQ